MSDEAIRNQYAKQGVTPYYSEHGATYRNPHEPIIRALLRRIVPAWHIPTDHILDLACGSGEVTLALQDLATAISAIDPYTHEAYAARTGHTAQALTFEQIAAGALAEQHYSVIICSFAMHLVEASRLPVLALQLAQISPHLLILTPHKRPTITPDWGWELTQETIQDRVRARLYQSSLFKS